MGAPATAAAAARGSDGDPPEDEEARDEAAAEVRAALSEDAAGAPRAVDAQRESPILPRFPSTEES